MSTYSTRFFHGLATTAGVVAYTVPASSVVVIRDLEVLNNDATAAKLNLAIGSPGSPSTALFLNAPPGVSTQWEGRIVVNAGEEIFVAATLPTTQVCVSGYLLTGP